ncbi:Pc16g09320 [Penicillium rubens Wisconsin 54-1255]|uniref:Pc16g09320 protein n=1 Tax=Penicillium rubens (strain ATCC 28089 / DSM 1075 / NRRL 1951 / Wisconsin 54-1255) TaxID=500485 RepID=B6H8C7_PENRW|nr:Pc16g09320 [Penicillium rubens Wisconsin 54-1255]
MQANAPGVPPVDRTDSTPSEAASNATGPERPPSQGHQRIVFTDAVALRYLEEDPSTDVLQRRVTLQGYEIYVVEQWACSRVHPTFIISTYTGDPSHTVIVGVLSVPTNEATWSPRLRMYFDAMKQCHARRKETPLGTVMVTDLSSFPSALSLIPIPDGDIKKHREDFIVNENLKRLGCAGRAGLKLQPPSAATEAKFHQLYRTSERITLYSAVMELVRQCQIALMVFDKLAPEYVDGLLCDVTEAAVSDWWTDIGTDLYNIEPSDSSLGPTSVAALLGTLLGARNRLHAYGAPVGKDAFDFPNMKRGIAGFQKSQKMRRSRRLDRVTLDRLHRVTAKAANAEGWTDAVKSTMAELSGQGGEMVMGMVRGRDKGGIADIETLDLDTFVQCCNGERAKWLWLGKPRKSGVEDGFTRGTGSGLDRPWKMPEPTAEEKDHRKKGVSGRVSDARAGLGRFKDAVGLQGLRHHHHSARDSSELTTDLAYHPSIDSDNEAPSTKTRTDSGLRSDRKISNDIEKLIEEEEKPQMSPTPDSERKAPEIHIEPVPEDEPETQAQDWPSTQQPPIIEEESDMERVRSQSTAASTDRERDRDGSISGIAVMALRRPQSYEEFQSLESEIERRDNFCARHLSFSTVEEVVLKWEPLGGKPTVKETDNLEDAIGQEDMLASEGRIFSSRIQELSQHTVPWVERQVESVDGLNQLLYDRHEELNSIYLERFGDYQRLRERSSDILIDESHHLADGVKRVELLGAKLDYELHVLESKVEDMEAGLSDFDRHIVNVETRIKALVKGEEQHDTSWTAWIARSMGFST